jgi:glutathione S-transferase
MKLFGSEFSPFVRRIRLLLADQPYSFVCLNIFESADREVLIRYNPTRKIPMLLDDGDVIFDSNVIARYLLAKMQLPALTWAQENTLTTINAANDSLVELLLCKRSGFDIQDDRLFFNLQRERVGAVLEVLEQKVNAGEFARWDYLAISLYCLIDWIDFRDMHDLSRFPALRAFVAQHASQAAVAESDPRRA